MKISGLKKKIADKIYKPVPRKNTNTSFNLHNVKSQIKLHESLLDSYPMNINSETGYTAKPFDVPAIPFIGQTIALEQDEDVQLNVNQLASMITGGEHYIITENEELDEYFTNFSKSVDFDILDTTIAKELLWYGNSVWKPRMGISQVKSIDDLMHIPISSFMRIWWDKNRVPYKYEFRGAEYQGYHAPDELLHFSWNHVNASVFGTGFAVSVLSERTTTLQQPNGGSVQIDLPSMLDRKYATQYLMQLGEQRYITSNVWVAEDATEEDRSDLQSQVENKNVGEDIIAGTKIQVQELGSSGRNFNAEQFKELTEAPIFKALNSMRGKNAGESGHSYANAETSADLDEIGLSAFPISMKTQLEKKLFKPWYNSNPLFSENYMTGLIPYTWEDIKFELNFGRVQKKDISSEDMIKLIELYQNNNVLMQDIRPLLDMYKQIGIPLSEDVTEKIVNNYNDPQNMMALEKLEE